VVIESNAPLLNIVELLVNPGSQAVEWYVTNKFPVHDGTGAVIGVMGTVQLYEGGRTGCKGNEPLVTGILWPRHHFRLEKTTRFYDQNFPGTGPSP
jgi:hypothetical protein